MSAFRNTAWNTSRIIAQNCGSLSEALYRVANLYRKTYNKLNYDMKTNGEYFLLDKLSKTSVRTVIDVGANKGEYTEACLRKFSSATIHSFEIAPPTYQKLKSNVSSERVKLNNFGLSNVKGSFSFNYNPKDDGSSSLIDADNIGHGDWHKIQLDVITGDEYCNRNQIKTIDLLKVDVEGAEHLVFSGFKNSFEGGIISSVQFEFGMVNIFSKFLLRDFYELFNRYGFLLGPIMPKGVDFKEYDTRNEDFQGPPNFFAVHRSKPHIIEAVKK